MALFYKQKVKRQ